MKNKSFALLKFLIGWPLSLVALIFLWHIFTPQLGTIRQNITHANFFALFLSLFTFQIYFLFRVLLWQAILKTKGGTISLRQTAWYWSVAEINRYIPGNVWSIVSRGAAFGKFGLKQPTLLAAWAQESVLIVLGSGIIGLFGLGNIFYNFLPRFFLKGSLYWTTIIVTLCLGVCWIFHKKILKMSFIPPKLHALFLEPRDASKQLFFSLVSFIFFGLGTYLAIVSFFYLPPKDITLFVGLFSLSFTIGYLSIITPMGLGVREFVVSGSLLSFLGSAVVGFASLFARFFLVVSELVFLGLSFLFLNVKYTFPSSISLHLKKYKYEYLLALSVIVYLLYFTTASFLRYTNFFTGRFDLGNMDQTVWNSLHGKLFQLTDPNGTNIMSRLGTHADFILILIAPLYLLWEDPRMLLFLQTAILALGAVFLFAFAKSQLKNRPVAFVLALSYLLNPSVQNTNLYDFHPVALATTFFLGAWYFLKQKKYVWTILFLVLAGMTKEEAWVVVGLFGLYFIVFEKRKIIGSILSLFSFGIFYLLVWKFIPAARGGQHFALSYYADYGNTPTSIIKNIILSPKKIIMTFLSFGRIAYLFELFFPVAFLALLSPIFLVFALPDIVINLLSSNTQLQQITFQYTAVITPFIFIATAYALGRIQKKYKRITLSFLSMLILLCTLTSAYLFGPLIGALHSNIDMFIHKEDDSNILENFLQDIPASFSVAASNNVGSHLSHRQKIYTIPIGIDKADIVVFLLNDQFAQPSLAEQKKLSEKLKHNKNYIEVFKENDFIVFEKRNLYTKSEPTLQKKKLYPSAIEALQHRDFEGGDIHIQKIIQRTKDFTTILFSYSSDGLTLYGRADIPIDAQQSPVVIVNRGFLANGSFNEQTSYQNISQAFAENGFLAITPDYRNNGQSDKDSYVSGIISYPIDVLNLINSLPTLSQADTKHIFLWGYSTGGQITLSTLAIYDQNKNIKPTIRAASVWAPVIDPYTAYLRFHQLFPTGRIPYQVAAVALGTYAKNPDAWKSVSPLYYIDDITTPVRVSHGLSDTISPYEWSIELYNNLKSFRNNTQLALYPNTDHNFTTTWSQAIDADINYFQTFLK